MLGIRTEAVGRWTTPTIVWEPEDVHLSLTVMGVIGNSVPTSETGKARLAKWKLAVASSSKAARGAQFFKPGWTYAVSAGFSFNLAEHGSQALDVENFLKPTFDALAAGLFCAPEQDLRTISRYDFDDSGFRYLFVHRLPDAPSTRDEGVAIVLSVRKQDAGLGV